MKKIYDHRELDYYNFLLKKNIDNDPDYLNKLKRGVITKKIHDLYKDENELLLLNLKISIPKFHVEMMSTLMQKHQGKYVSRYGLFRLCEIYLTHTDWYQKLDNKTSYMINIDFYKTIILSVHRSLKAVHAYEKQ